MASMHFASVIVHNAGTQGQLNVGILVVALGRYKALCFRHVGRDPTRSLASPLQHGLEHVPRALE